MAWLLHLIRAFLEWLFGRKKATLNLEFKERNMPKPTDIVPQEVSVHADKTYDIVGSTSDSSVGLTNLRFEPSPSPVGVSNDNDGSDDNAVLDTTGVSVDATATITFLADGSDGKTYEAIANVTVVAPEVTVEAMSLTFTERAS